MSEHEEIKRLMLKLLNNAQDMKIIIGDNEKANKIWSSFNIAHETLWGMLGLDLEDCKDLDK